MCVCVYIQSAGLLWPYGNSICPSDASARGSCAGRRRPAPRTSSFGGFAAAELICKCFIVVNRAVKRNTTSKLHRRRQWQSSQAGNTVYSGATWLMNLLPNGRASASRSECLQMSLRDALCELEVTKTEN